MNHVQSHMATSMIPLISIAKPSPCTLGIEGHFTHETKSPWPLHLVEKAELVQVCFRLRLRDQQSMWMQEMDVKSTWIYMASNGSCFIVTWTTFKKHLLEVDLTKNLETMALRIHTIVNLFYFMMYEDSHEWKFIGIAFGWGPQSHMASHYIWGYVTTRHDFNGALGQSLDNFFGALTISWSQLVPHVWSGPDPLHLINRPPLCLELNPFDPCKKKKKKKTFFMIK